MNRGKAFEMLCFNKKVTAAEAEALGLVTRVFDRSAFAAETGVPFIYNFETIFAKEIGYSSSKYSIF
jgi:enoyl-CoA hydratase/carnithine racemase